MSSYMESVINASGGHAAPEDVLATAGSKPAPQKDRVYGSNKNPKGSASGSKKITFSKKVEKSLQEKADTHNEKYGSTPSKKTSLKTLKAVYRRGAGAFSTSHRPDQNRNSWAMARVNAFLKLLKSGKPSNPKYTTDYDLLPPAHPKSTKTASASTQYLEFELDKYIDSLLDVKIMDFSEYGSDNHFIFAMTEFAGLGYETLPAFRAAWGRAIKENDPPFERVLDLAISLYDSKDADLLPKQEI